MAPSRRQLCVALLVLLAGSGSVPRASAAGFKMPFIPWFSALRGSYIDLLSRRPLLALPHSAAPAAQSAAARTTSLPQAAAQAAPAAAALSSAVPRPAVQMPSYSASQRSLDFWEKCARDPDSLGELVTKCNYVDTPVTCEQLSVEGSLPKGVQSYVVSQLTGSYSLPAGCASATLGTTYDAASYRLTFNSPQVPILAVITRDRAGSMVSYLGAGSAQGRVKHRSATQAEFCFASAAGSVGVASSAVYSTGMQPGTASWAFSKSVALAPPYRGTRAVMFNGDSVDATWTLQTRKTGTDVNYQGVVSGTIVITNPVGAPISVTSVVGQVASGPTATVACPAGTPFTVPACGSITCQYTAYFPKAPPAGTYSVSASAQFVVQGSQGYPASAQGTAAFNVGATGAALATSAGTIPAGAAMVTDASSPAGKYVFAGAGAQTYTTALTCNGGTAASGAVSSTATLTGSNGQQITSSATVSKSCYDMRVSVATKAAPFVGHWGWSVNKVASPAALTLRPEQSAYGGASPLAFGRDYASTTTGDVVYTVTYTRSAPSGAAGAAAFEASGEVYLQNPAPINARLQGVYVSISNARGGSPYVAPATCPVLIIPAGQRVTCTWRATPGFNPVGQQVRAVARYVNTKNGEPSGSTTDFNSAPATIGGGADAAAAAGSGRRRRLQQTWGGSRAAAAAVAGSGVPEILGALPATIYSLNGAPIVVPGSVANGTGVIVSGNTALGGDHAAPGARAMSAAGATPVILDSSLFPSSGSGGAAFVVSEAGPAGVAAAMDAAFSGLQDECVNVADAFVGGSAADVGGHLVSGTPPSGRICGTTTFTYTMRYGPYADCAPRKSVNAATFQALDTGATGSCQADVAIAVEGCASPASLRLTPLKAVTSARGGYTWSVEQRADTDRLAVGQDATSPVTFTVDIKRSGAKAGATLSAEVAVANPTSHAVALEGATFTATTTCNGAPRATSGAATCDSLSVPARGQVSCRIAAPLPCAGSGAYTLVLTAGGGATVASPPAKFAFNDAALSAQNTGSACADVSDVFKAGAGLVDGTVVAGELPSGKLCGSQSFTYTVEFGPFAKCGVYKAVKSAALASNSSGVPAAVASLTLPIAVVGCNLYTDLARAADCVNPAAWWPHCDTEDDTKCAGGWRLLPGGAGRGTPFFPLPNQRTARTYASMLADGSAASSGLAASRRAYVDAGREYVAAQLNFLSGARLPGLELQDAYDAIAAFLSTSTEGGAMSDDVLHALQGQTALLARYNNGTLPRSYGAPPRCS